MIKEIKKISRYFLLTSIMAILLSCSVLAEDVDKGDGSLEQVTFIELGSVKCIPCKMMQPVMDSVEKNYKGKVKVVFYDVWTREGEPYGDQYGIRAIPTQIFLDKDGKEFYRHTGFLAENIIEEILMKHGVTKE